MSNQFEHGELGSVQFQNFLAAAMPIIKSKQFTNIDYDELNCYAEFLQYRVQRDLYELWKEGDPDSIFWEEFVFIMRGQPELRDMALSVICRNLNNTFFDFDFTPKEICLFRESDNDAGDRPGGAVLFSKEEGIVLMGMFLYFAECAHFNRLQDTVRPGCRLEEYQHELRQDQELWTTVITAFRDALQRLDFKADWLEVLKEHGA